MEMTLLKIPGNGCKLQGTWIGEVPYPLPDETPMDPTDDVYYMLKFFAVYHGTGDNEGTEVLEWINPVQLPALDGATSVAFGKRLALTSTATRRRIFLQ